jgi:hypothetical protein
MWLDNDKNRLCFFYQNPASRHSVCRDGMGLAREDHIRKMFLLSTLLKSFNVVMESWII